MRLLPILVFFIYLYVEISIFVAVANSIGVLLALIAIIATSIIGLSLVKSQGLKNLAAMQQKMANNENPTDEMVKNISLMIGGFLLLIPGFLTDILGALLLLPPVQQFFVKRIVPKMKVRSYRFQSSQSTKNESDIIEGEFKHKNDD
ncbi:membrane protein FxsA [Orbus sasakiae]|uniref:Membrane protein FxsA n=1 Tax=Orbus sasakiae TaxID=1078475 RepID=A0ABP9NH89_9GAMM